MVWSHLTTVLSCRKGNSSSNIDFIDHYPKNTKKKKSYLLNEVKVIFELEKETRNQKSKCSMHNALWSNAWLKIMLSKVIKYDMFYVFSNLHNH